MKQFTFYLIIVSLLACNSSGTEKEQQKTIDSLNNVIKSRDENDAKEKEVIKKKQIGANERNDVLTKVTTDQATFTPVEWGGFKNIKFNLFNDYKHTLDQVILKVHYIRQSGVEIKSEPLILTNIAPLSHTALTAPDYQSAGRTLKITIETILCKEINLCYYSSVIDTKSSDPYICK